MSDTFAFPNAFYYEKFTFIYSHVDDVFTQLIDTAELSKSFKRKTSQEEENQRVNSEGGGGITR